MTDKGIIRNTLVADRFYGVVLAAFAFAGAQACASDASSKGTSGGGGDATSSTATATVTTGTGADPCTGVLDCNAGFRALLNSVPACKSCLEASCSAEIAGCGPMNEQCADSVACYADPLFADSGGSMPPCEPGAWPFGCYLTRQECVDARAAEPMGLAFFQCMTGPSCNQACAVLVTGGANCGDPPACSVLSM